ncbi:hypothetical protein BD410DRAFT_791341 [Rickenella mellea]|uniref:DUF6593 domain-containing protein n=1 Tax=Rickenella mellea TaxID=50990 RepID=A0A4Y7PYY7_9AGAM|nr:hypothetical protein BD410DRAFT_791341 [Rickenella mellea]
MAQRLSFTTSSIHNVVISNSSDVIYYEIVTPKWEPSLTRVRKMDHVSKQLEVVAEIKNEQEKPISLRLRGEQFRSTDEFLHQDENAAIGKSAKFKGKDGKQYEWCVRRDCLELVMQGDPRPVAVYRSHKRFLLIIKISQEPSLEIQPSVMDTLDSLIVSWHLMERKRRCGFK